MNHYTLAEMTPGLTEEFTVTVTPEMMDAFRAITGDVSPIHIDADYARGRGFPGRVVYGMLGASFFSTLAGVYLPGEHCLLHGVECKFAKPIFIGDTLTVKGTVVSVSEIGSEAEIKAVITNQDGKRVTRGIIKAGLAKSQGENHVIYLFNNRCHQRCGPRADRAAAAKRARRYACAGPGLRRSGKAG